jgi:hypothetical protein
LEKVGVLETRERFLAGDDLLRLDPVVVEAKVGSVFVEVLLVAGERGREQLEHVQGKPAGVHLLEYRRDGRLGSGRV